MLPFKWALDSHPIFVHYNYTPTDTQNAHEKGRIHENMYKLVYRQNAAFNASQTNTVMRFCQCGTHNGTLMSLRPNQKEASRRWRIVSSSLTTSGASDIITYLLSSSSHFPHAILHYYIQIYNTHKTLAHNNFKSMFILVSQCPT